jgi:hypothetical protein
LDESSDARRLPPEALVGVVATVLAEALRLAAEAERWEIVAQVAEELAARRKIAREAQSDRDVDPGGRWVRMCGA